MDHIPIPKDPARPTPRVRYYCTAEYDNSDFLTYPARIGWSEAELFNQQTWTHLDQPGKRTSAEAAAFLQQWLFFGLLRAFFGDAFKPSDFVVSEADQDGRRTTHYINSTPLPHLLRASNGSYYTRLAHLDRCVARAHALYMFVIYFGKKLDPYLLLSLGLLGRSACGWLHLGTQSVGFWPAPTFKEDVFPPGWDGAHDVLSYEMAEAGWCRRRIKLSAALLDLGSAYFASQLKGGDDGPGQDHGRCSASKCEAFNIVKGSYRSVHTESCHRECGFLAVDVEELESIILDGKVPLIDVDDEGGGISLLRGDATTDYVAISHVWSDGLGNPQRNAMPRCQVEEINRLVAETFANEDSRRRVPFWMDTLCCPTIPGKAKKMALTQMRNIYHQAERVLVLDAGLRSVEREGRSVEELAYRVYLSTWASRLWTLQEGRLAQLLFVQFADGVFDFRNVVLGANSTVDMAYVVESVWKPWKTVQDGSHDTRMQLTTACAALHTRSTSFKHDEALCLGSLVGADMGPIVEAEPDARMKAFWSTMTQVPRDLLFWTEPRLTHPGLRWAPKSFLQAHRKLVPDLKKDSPPPAAVTERGLMAQVYSIKLSMKLPLQNPFCDICMISDEDGNWKYVLSGFTPALPDEDALARFSVPEDTYSWAAILATEPLRDTAVEGQSPMVMVFVYAEEDGVIYARRGVAGFIYHLEHFKRHLGQDAFVDALAAGLAGPPNKNKSMEGKNHLLQGSYVAVVGTRVDSLQTWCID
ncbi:Het domain protein [Lasiodiplodia theobromae]|uniref:Het domain protein n=1 Tax=Lasiodiplodia theobromae TaxID=45133 RepID=UPI0015C33A35|nr:Het domain protein [Lasiodiplodia theobromae]KAF4545445.1 Het domain protein [Lasiodiplodia theobromae]